MSRPQIIDTIAEQCKPAVTFACKRHSSDGDFYRCHVAFSRSTSCWEPMQKAKAILREFGVMATEYREIAGYHGFSWVMSAKAANRKEVVA